MCQQGVDAKLAELVNREIDASPVETSTMKFDAETVIGKKILGADVENGGKQFWKDTHGRVVTQVVGQVGNFDLVILLIDSKLLDVLRPGQLQLEELLKIHLHWLVLKYFFGFVGNVSGKLIIIHHRAAGLLDISHNLVNRVIVSVIHND